MTRCERCGLEFTPLLTEEDADAEYRLNFPDESAAGEPRALLCDECWRWFWRVTEGLTKPHP